MVSLHFWTPRPVFSIVVSSKDSPQKTTSSVCEDGLRPSSTMVAPWQQITNWYPSRIRTGMGVALKSERRSHANAPLQSL